METKEIRYCRALYQVAVSINSTLDPWKVVDAIAESTARALQTGGCSLMLLSPDRRQLLHRASYGLSDRYVQKGPVKVDPSLEEALAGRSVAVLDVATDPRVQYRLQSAEEGITSHLSVPMRLQGEVIGVMRIYTTEPREFTTEDLEFVEAVANLGAIALNNATRYEAMKSDLDAVCTYAYGAPLARN